MEGAITLLSALPDLESEYLGGWLQNQRKEEEGKWGPDVGGAHLIGNILNVSKDSFNLKVETFAKLFVSSRQNLRKNLIHKIE